MTRFASKIISVAATLLIVGAIRMAIPEQVRASDGRFPPDISSFRVGIQAYTFRGNTFEEAVKKAASLGLTYIEGYPGQAFGSSMPGEAFTPGATPQMRAKARDILRKNGVHMYSYGVVGLPDDTAGCRQIFQFAKDMGVQVLVAEPAPRSWPVVDAMVKEFNIRVAIHNHPKPDPYFDPHILLADIKGLDKRIGCCADVGHWMRCGFDPVQSLKLFPGRVFDVHLKDLKEMGNVNARDYPLGQGITDIPGIFKELKAQKFNGIISIEYEEGQPDPTADVQESLNYLRKILGT